MKTLIILFITVVFGISLTGDTTNKAITPANAETKKLAISTNDPRIDFILGNWVGSGFVTDANGLQQYIEIQETNSSVSNDQYQIVGMGKNPGNSFVYAYNKSIFFNNTLKAWYTKGTINNTILLDSRTILGENNTFSYTYYDINSILVRHTTTRDSEDSFTETQEKWGQNGWDTTAWFRMTRNFINRNSTVTK